LRKNLSFLQLAAQRDGLHPHYTPYDRSGPTQTVCAWEEHNEAILFYCELSRHRCACTNMPPSSLVRADLASREVARKSANDGQA